MTSHAKMDDASASLAVLSSRDPASMSSSAIVAEVGALLAWGYRRLSFRQKPLDGRAPVEAACRPLNGAESGGKVA